MASFKSFSRILLSKFILSVWMVLLSTTTFADWAKNFGGPGGGNARAQQQFVDSSGNVYLVGYFNSSTLVMGSYTLSLMGTIDAFVVKMDSSGTVLWAKNFGSNLGLVNASATGVSVDGSGNVYVTGMFNNNNLTTPALIKIGTSSLRYTGFLIKMDSSGAISWSKNFGGTSVSVNNPTVAVDGSGNVFVGGSFSGTFGNMTTPALTRIGSADALLIKFDSSGNITWSKNFGGSGVTVAINQTNFSGGNVYLGGNFNGGDLTTPALAKIGTQDGLVFKVDTSGNVTWVKNFGGSGSSFTGSSVAVDSSNNVFLSGSFTSANLTVPNLALTGTIDAVVLKLDSTGSVTWAQDFGGSGASAYALSVVTDSSSAVYVGGKFLSANLTTPSVSRIGSTDGFLFKLDSSSGATTWSKNFGASGATAVVMQIAYDSFSSSILCGGYFSGSSLTTPAVSRVGGTDVLSIKLNTSGVITWAKNFGGTTLSTGSITSNGITKDTNGNIYLSGYSNLQPAQFGAVTLPLTGNQDAYVVKMDPYGSVSWAKSFGGASASVGFATVTVDGSGNVFLWGYYGGSSLTNPALTLIGTQDSFLIKLDSSGNIVWSKSFGGSGASMYAQRIALDNSGNIFLSGYFKTANLTTPALSLLGTQDAFAMKLDSSGTVLWSKNFGGSGATTVGYGMAIDSNGNTYLGGYFKSANLTTPNLSLIGTQDSFVFKLDTSGNVLAANGFGGSGSSSVISAVAVDSAFNIYLVGTVSGASFTTPVATLVGTQDAFVFKLDSSRNVLWTNNFGGSSAYAIGGDIAVEKNGNIFLAGSFTSANLTNPAFTKIGSADLYGIRMNSSGSIIWSKNFGGASSGFTGASLFLDGTGNAHLAGGFSSGNLTMPALTKIGSTDTVVIDVQLYNTACTTAGKIKYDTTNSVMVFCDGSYWQSMNNNSASTCTGTTAGKSQYYANAASSDFVWYGGSCRSSKSTTTYGACAVNGKLEWYSTSSTLRACINGTWTSLKGW